MDDLPKLGAFIVFNRTLETVECVKGLKRKCCKSNFKLFDKHRLKVTRADAPSNILWENLEVGKCESFWRSFLMVCVMILLLAFTFSMIYIIRVMSSKMVLVQDCTPYSNVKFDTVNPRNKVAIECFCSRTGVYGNNGTDVCNGWKGDYAWRTVLTIIASFVVSMVNFFLKVAMKKMAPFERYKTITGMNKSILFKLFIALTINMGGLLIIINLNLQGWEWIWILTYALPLGPLYFFTGRFGDISRDWYIYVGYSLLTLVISNFVISIVFGYVWQFIRWLKKHCLRRSKVLQIDLNKLYEGYLFGLHERYATCLAFLFVTMAYCGPIPLLIPLLAMFFVARYWTDKFVLLKFSWIPPNFDEKMHKLVTKILPYALFVHLIFNIWSYGAPDVFPQDIYSKTDTNTGNVSYYYHENDIWKRMTSTMGLPFFILLIIAVTVYLFEGLVLSFVYKFACKKYKVDLQQATYEDSIEDIKKHSYGSYNPLTMPKYARIMMAIEDAAKVNKVKFDETPRHTD
jgi:ABC-type multidrug transport system fused ATPase/permease subunit